MINFNSFLDCHRTLVLKLFVFILLFGWFFLFAAQKIDLTTADLGRHIENGKVILSSLHNPAQLHAVLNTNFYSYTNPDASFINHHWGSGVIFYLIWKSFGFNALSLFYIFLNFLAFLFAFDLTKRVVDAKTAIILSFLTIPLIASRAEIRPEVFSYLFTIVFLWILWRFRESEMSAKWLVILPVVIIFWVNLHIYFFIGIALVILFLFEQLVLFSLACLRRSDLPTLRNVREVGPPDVPIKHSYSTKIRVLGLTFLAAIGCSIINPFGIKELFYPLRIFDKYGYLLVENQSVWFLQNLHFNSPNFVWFKVLLAFLIGSFLFIVFTDYRKVSIIYSLVAGGAALMACLAIRNFPLFALLILPAMGYNVSVPFKKTSFRLETLTTAFAIVLIILASLTIYWSLLKETRTHGIGLLSENNRASEFIKDNDIKGPIFNNYDIGGFLIFNLFPDEKVFVDNRPEAYPVDFFQQVYIPMQQDKTVWQRQDEKYGFNAVIFAWHDATPWGQNFLTKIVRDPDWAPVFIDDYVLILLRRSVENEKLIEKYEIPQTVFQTI